MAHSTIKIAQYLAITESHTSKGSKMRRKFNPETSLFGEPCNSEIAKELERISLVLDANPQLIDIVYGDLIHGRRSDTGRKGMNAEQVLRCVILKQYRELAYDELCFHVNDSSAFRHFSRLDHGQYPCKAVLQENIKKLSEETWESIHKVVIGYAIREQIETGKKVRIDSTAVETDIHHPTDSTLLADGVRIMTRWLLEGKMLTPRLPYSYSDHSRIVKKRLMTILNTKKDEVRKAAYRDLLHYAGKVAGYSLEAIPMLKAFAGTDLMDIFKAKALAGKLERALGILRRVMDQTERRVFKGEKVPASQKVVSFFEDHTDIIFKGGRDTQYGHKVFLSGGASNLILKLFRGLPRQVACDGGFASKDNLAFAKSNGVKDAVFSKRRGLSVLDMARSAWVYKKLRNFRAGIEAGISVLKRAFGLDRCKWRGWGGFKQYVWSSIVSYNLLVIARIKLATV